MNIAVNTKQSKHDGAEGIADLVNCFSLLAKEYSQHRFIYIFDQAFDQELITSENIIPIVAGPEAKTSLRLQYWFNYKLPSVLKKYKADVFVSMDGICSLRTKVPQCLLLDDLSFIDHPEFYAKSTLRFNKKFIPKFLAKTKVIAATSEPAKEAIIKQYGIDKEKIRLVYRSAASVFHPIDELTKESTKEKYADGKEYFIYAGPIEAGKNLITLLKAFSFFKKRQKSSMQLVIAGKAASGYHQFANDLKTFKFRNEVKWMDDLSIEEHIKVLGAAYAIVYPVFVAGNDAVLIQAMQCDVPVIVSTAVRLPDPVSNAVLYADPNNFMDLADKMMLIFKDEDRRNQLAMAGKLAARSINRTKTADMLWECIVAAIKTETA